MKDAFMREDKSTDLQHFVFRNLHPNIYMGTASDRYAGWLGQIYSETAYADNMTRRSKTVAGRPFVEELLPVKSVEEYFRHFRTLELDFTFYRPLREMDGTPTQNFHLLRAYRRYLNKGDHLILKVPQIVFARKVLRNGTHIINEQYLDPIAFSSRFYEPALELLGTYLDGFIFEQEYQRKQDRPSPEAHAKELDTFFSAIAKDARYHVELRTESLLARPVFDVLERHGVGQVLSHWTWLPSLLRQFALSGGMFLNHDRHCIIRLMTPRGMRYEEAYARAHPFNGLVDGMLREEMVKETADMMQKAVDQSARVSVIVNNRAGGNAPLIALQIAQRFRKKIQVSR
jgi:uncharacterized protein YecE (DUF72 family)